MITLIIECKKKKKKIKEKNYNLILIFSSTYLLLFPPTSLSAYFLAWSRDIQNKRKKKTSQAEYIYINIKIGNTILVIFILSVQTRATYILQIISSNLILQEEKKNKKERITYIQVLFTTRITRFSAQTHV